MTKKNGSQTPLSSELAQIISLINQAQARLAQDAPNPLPRRYTVREAARHAGVSGATMYRIVEAGAIRVVRNHAGGHMRITEADLIDWLEGRGPACTGALAMGTHSEAVA